MNAGKPDRGMNFTGTFIGSAVGANNTITNSPTTVGGGQPQVSLDDLRTTFTAVHEELLAAAGSADDQADVRYEVRKISDELAKDEPEGPVVRSRWTQVLEVLGKLGAVSDHVAKITDMISKLFGGS